jgi:hypothetical protein
MRVSVKKFAFVISAAHSSKLKPTGGTIQKKRKKGSGILFWDGNNISGGTRTGGTFPDGTIIASRPATQSASTF